MNDTIKFSTCSFALVASLFALLTPPAFSATAAKTAQIESTVYVAGDIADCRKVALEQTGAAKTAKVILAGLQAKPDAWVLTLGDNTYPIGAPKEFNDCYDKTWGAFKTRTLPSPGNHDYGVPLAHGYFNYFGALAGDAQRGYYSRKIGSWQLLALNSNLSGAEMEQQLSWLKDELQQKRALCTLAFWHHPVFSTGGHGDNTVMRKAWEILVQEKADLVLAAHDHNYERFIPLNAAGYADAEQGIRSFVVGTGGAHLGPMFFPRETTEVRQNEVHGVLKLDLSAQGYQWEFLAVDGQVFKDKGQGVCH
ncbi:MAG: metallophosphoesterase [Burkholderiales bacterium]|nr:metallophosphoesterase [Burkholderiales bacterium]